MVRRFNGRDPSTQIVVCPIGHGHARVTVQGLVFHDLCHAFVPIRFDFETKTNGGQFAQSVVRQDNAPFVVTQTPLLGTNLSIIKRHALTLYPRVEFGMFFILVLDISNDSIGY